MNPNTRNSQGSSCSSVSNLDDGFDFVDLNDSYLEEFSGCLEDLSESESNMKRRQTKNDENKKVKDVDMVETNILPEKNESTNSREITESDLDQVGLKLRKSNNTSLLAAVKTFIKNTEFKGLKTNIALKKGLCFSWLSNNYVCTNQQCLYNHDALELFTRKLKVYPSKFIMTLVVTMRNDILFVDVVMAAFKVMSKRKVPVVWVTFLIFFVFYVINPSDSRFLKFWANAARFFCQLDKNYSAANGFASLLSIFLKGEESEEWKIIEFIKLIKQSPVRIRSNYALLQPVLKMDLPLQFLTEAVESCIATQKDVLNVYSSIVPKIFLMTSSIQIVELLLKLCKTLEEIDCKNYANDLKQRLREKVLSFKTKITHPEYTLTASFQKKISFDSTKENRTITFYAPKATVEDLKITEPESNYFQLEEGFCNLVTQAMELSHETLPSRYRSAECVGERQMNRMRQFFRNCQFDLLGKLLNEMQSNAVERAAEEFLKLFRMKISLQQGVDLIKIIILPCKSENAAKIIASISISLVLNLVRINEWEKAYTLVSLCQEKQINLLEGKVFYFKEPIPVTQSRIALLLVEIYACKENYASALSLIKKYFLFSSNNALWRLTWKEHDESIRVRIIEDLLQQIISSKLNKEAHDLFWLVLQEQKQLYEPVDLIKFTNEILILLLNQNDEDALNLYEEIKADVQLNDITLRAIVVTLVRRNRLSAAKCIMLSTKQYTYSLSEIFGTAAINVSSFWLEEEIYAVFDVFFDLFNTKKPNFNMTDCNDVEIKIQLSKPNLSSSSSFRPLCLGIINSAYKDACARIQRVLQYQFDPPLKLLMMSYCIKLDADSVRLHLNKRMNQN